MPKLSKIETPLEDNTTSVTRPSGIVIKDTTLRPQEFPLIINLPSDASKAQIERARILNAYAYESPKGWALYSERLLKELEALKDAPDPVELNPNGPKLEIGPTLPA